MLFRKRGTWRLFLLAAFALCIFIALHQNFFQVHSRYNFNVNVVVPRLDKPGSHPENWGVMKSGNDNMDSDDKNINNNNNNIVTERSINNNERNNNSSINNKINRHTNSKYNKEEKDRTGNIRSAGKNINYNKIRIMNNYNRIYKNSSSNNNNNIRSMSDYDKVNKNSNNQDNIIRSLSNYDKINNSNNNNSDIRSLSNNDKINNSNNNNSDIRSISNNDKINKNSNNNNHNNSNNHNDYLTVDLKGRLGNQMFKYASLLGVASMNKDKTPFFPYYSTLAQTFEITHVRSSPRQVSRGYFPLKEIGYGTYDTRLAKLPAGRSVKLNGYLQSYKYFQNMSSKIRKEFTFKPSIINKARDIFSMIEQNLKASEGGPSELWEDVIMSLVLIGVHVRRGDMLAEQNYKIIGHVAPASYFQKAFKLMRAKYGDVIFLVTSDGMDWTREHVTGRDVIFLPDATPEVHMCVLSQCDHVIMSVGTFGWWAGWLAGGDVIYYDSPRDKAMTLLAQQFKHDDFYPKHWTGIDA